MNRDERLARNEVLFREVNERIEEVASADRGMFEFLCECGAAACTDIVRMTAREYEAVRADPTTFVLIRGHEVEDIEHVVSQTDRFNVVRKRPGEDELARTTDPRSR